jgi:anti-sigma factor RsiW
MAAKLSKADRAEAEKNLTTCESLAATFRQMLKDDDEADKAAAKAGDRALISGIAHRDGTKAAIMAIREMPRRGGPQE